MSIFDSFSNSVLGISQDFFGDSCTYKQGLTEIELKAVFARTPVEINGYATEALTVEILEGQLGEVIPVKGATVIKNSKSYKVDSAQLNNGVYLIFLKE